MENRTVILAAGDFPKKGGAAWKLLAAATRVIACDSAADAYRRRFRKWPDVIIGDLDSICGQSTVPEASSPRGVGQPGRLPAPRRETRRVRCSIPTSIDVIHDADQNTNDLEKAISYCAKQGWRRPVIVGATGKREDHAIGNVFRALAYGCEIVTDFGRFIPVCGKAMFKVKKGAAVSIFAPDPKTRMTSKGLAWPLDNVKFRNLYCATLNRATGTRVVLTSTKPVSVYIES